MATKIPARYAASAVGTDSDIAGRRTITSVCNEMAPVTARAKLRQALSEELVPVLLNSGFAGPAKIGGNSLVHEYRRTTGSGVQVLSIQLEKNQLPRFILNFYMEPEEGIERVIAEGGTVLAGCLKSLAQELVPRGQIVVAESCPWPDRYLGGRGGETVPGLSSGSRGVVELASAISSHRLLASQIPRYGCSGRLTAWSRPRVLPSSPPRIR